jgi:GntR family transcriptional regulator
MATESLRARRSLPARLSDDLRARLRAREWAPGSQMPTEVELMREYEVSRATVRQALTVLESQGLVTIRHGRGSFVADQQVIHAGMQELQSITETIAAQGHRAGQRYRSMTWRAPTAEERDALDTPEDEPVLDVQRAFLADERVVAFGYEVLAPGLLPADFAPEDLRMRPLFDYLEGRAGVMPARAVAHVHAVASDEVGWEHEEPPPRLYVLLDQVIYDLRSRPILHSRIFFIEGRFDFVVARAR